MNEKQAIIKDYVTAVIASQKASEARYNLPAGSSRAQVTSANAKWTACAENRDRLAKMMPGDLASKLMEFLSN